MKRGFMKHVATILVPEFPGETASWYAKAFLDEAGEDGSDSKTKEQSLANTLNKQVKEERERRIWRKKLNDGKYHYFPTSISPTADYGEETIVQISLSAQELRNIDNLVAVGKFKSRSNAIKWLVMEGTKANRNYLDKVADTISQIEQLKKEVVT
jgi:Arc/MetJ-type ribon-helix-helix transcriptional regulator